MNQLKCLLIVLFSSLCLCNQCGIRQAPFIIGGDPAEQGEFPWFVELRLHINETFINYCGAALIADNWALTAAHCVLWFPNLTVPIEPHYFDAYIGVTDTDAKDLSEHRAKVVKLIHHEDYKVELNGDLVKSENDIALVKLDTSSTKVPLQTLCLPNEPNVEMTNECWIAGFGSANATDSGNAPPVNKMNKLREFISEDKNCLQPHFSFNSSVHLCVGGRPEGGHGACHGDSGSAFLCKGTDSRYYQMGVTSYATDYRGLCAQPGKPVVYSKVRHYLEWIDRTIKNN